MSGGTGCTCGGATKAKRARWVVMARMCNHSAFNGYHYTPSDWSRVACNGCGNAWRTKAAYVSALPDGEFTPPGLTGAP